jgi:primosomal replication protein N
VEIRGRAIGPITERLLAAPLGVEHGFEGFVGAQRNGRGVVFHIQSIELKAERSSHAPAPR